jgi:hypothetical protein
MTARTLFLAAALVGLTSAGLFEAHVLARQDDEMQALQKRLAEARRQTTALHRETDAACHELNAAEAQLAVIPVAFVVNPAATRQAEANAWLARVKRLQRLFDERPGQRIPEMQWLTDDDWLRLAKRASFDDDHHTRKALGEVRAQATTNFFKSLNRAVHKFALTANGEPPSSTLALAPYFEPPIDPTILARYEFTKGDASSIGPGAITVREKAPIDAEYDSSQFVSTNGTNLSSGSSPPPYAWMPDFSDRMRRAFSAYMKANDGARAAGILPVLPYFDPPLDPARVGLILRFEQDREKP